MDTDKFQETTQLQSNVNVDVEDALSSHESSRLHFRSARICYAYLRGDVRFS